MIHSERADIAWFACGGPVDIVVEVGHEVKRVEVRPLRHGLQPAIQGRTLRFRIPGPVKLSVEINGNLRQPLFLFADAPEQDAPKPGAPGVRRFAGGQIHEAGELTLASGQSLYLEPGAVVRGTIAASPRGTSASSGGASSMPPGALRRRRFCDSPSVRRLAWRISSCWAPTGGPSCPGSASRCIANVKLVSSR